MTLKLVPFFLVPAPRRPPLTEHEAESVLQDALREHGKEFCPSCGRKIDRGDVAWNGADTDAGTPWTWAEIICQQCDTEIARWNSWYSGDAADFVSFAENILPDWRQDY